MQKQTIILQGLLSVSLLTFISSADAQESVSTYEQSLINKSEAITQARPENALAGIPANFDMQELTNKLKARGWNIQHKTDGSLILIPRKSSGKKADKNTSKNEQWQQLQQEFQNAGWSAELDADGAIRLTPPHIAQTTKPEENNPINKNNEDNSFQNMQKKLKESGWGISNNSDGSILLYPPKQAVSIKPSPCPGMKPTVKVSLPVDSWQKAHDIAQGWLRNQTLPHSAVGKIRKIFNVYIISIVSDVAPFVLLHQIAIRNSNGAVIVLN